MKIDSDGSIRIEADASDIIASSDRNNPIHVAPLPSNLDDNSQHQEYEMLRQGAESMADSKLAVMEVSNNNSSSRVASIKRSVLAQNRDTQQKVKDVKRLRAS